MSAVVRMHLSHLQFAVSMQQGRKVGQSVVAQAGRWS